jgi:hypothetical protein
MANIGSFDPELRPVIWFDRTILPEGWFEYSLNFDDPNIASAVVAAAYVPYDLPHSYQHQAIVAQ